LQVQKLAEKVWQLYTYYTAQRHGCRAIE
jgi:hypothetical protein